jgi:hypothetical protein
MNNHAHQALLPPTLIIYQHPTQVNVDIVEYLTPLS